MLKITAKDEGVGSCPLCRELIGEAATACPGCETGYHDDCLLEFGGTCVTLGCRKTLPGFEAAPLDLPEDLLAPPTADRAPAPDAGAAPEAEPPRPSPSVPWRWPPPAVWILTGLIWIAPTTLYRLAAYNVFFDLAYWTEVLALALPVWCAAALVIPMVLDIPRRW